MQELCSQPLVDTRDRVIVLYLRGGGGGVYRGLGRTLYLILSGWGRRVWIERKLGELSWHLLFQQTCQGPLLRVPLVDPGEEGRLVTAADKQPALLH